MKGKRPSRLLLALGLVLLFGVAGCATSGGGSRGASVLRRDIGAVMVAPLTAAREKIFGRYTIPVLREEDTARSLYWESQWLPRNLTPEESAAGVTEARNRVFLRGNYVDERLDGTVVVRVRYEVENYVRTATDPEWHPGAMPPTVEERFDGIYKDLMLELRVGIIR